MTTAKIKFTDSLHHGASGATGKAVQPSAPPSIAA